MFRPPSSNLRCKQKCAESIRIGLMCLRINGDWLTIFFHPSNLGSKMQSIIVQMLQKWSHSHRRTKVKPTPNLTSLYQFRLQNFMKSTNFLRHMVYLNICQGALFCHFWSICTHSILVSGKFWWINLECFQNQMTGLERFRILLFASEVQARRPEHSYGKMLKF